jgi:hypothetical protein
MPFAYIGVRLATAPSQAVEVVRVKANLFRRPNLIVSPAGRDELVSVAGRALGEWQEMTGRE